MLILEAFDRGVQDWVVVSPSYESQNFGQNDIFIPRIRGTARKSSHHGNQSARTSRAIGRLPTRSSNLKFTFWVSSKCLPVMNQDLYSSPRLHVHILISHMAVRFNCGLVDTVRVGSSRDTIDWPKLRIRNSHRFEHNQRKKRESMSTTLASAKSRKFLDFSAF